ncbi:MAG: hypothetical protein ACHQJ6_04595 [Candidatus Berkiellales bacterium]
MLKGVPDQFHYLFELIAQGKFEEFAREWKTVEEEIDEGDLFIEFTEGPYQGQSIFWLLTCAFAHNQPRCLRYLSSRFQRTTREDPHLCLSNISRIAWQANAKSGIHQGKTPIYFIVTACLAEQELSDLLTSADGVMFLDFDLPLLWSFISLHHPTNSSALWHIARATSEGNEDAGLILETFLDALLNTGLEEEDEPFKEQFKKCLLARVEEAPGRSTSVFYFLASLVKRKPGSYCWEIMWEIINNEITLEDLLAEPSLFLLLADHCQPSSPTSFRHFAFLWEKFHRNLPHALQVSLFQTMTKAVALSPTPTNISLLDSIWKEMMGGRPEEILGDTLWYLAQMAVNNSAIQYIVEQIWKPLEQIPSAEFAAQLLASPIAGPHAGESLLWYSSFHPALFRSAWSRCKQHIPLPALLATPVARRNTLSVLHNAVLNCFRFDDKSALEACELFLEFWHLHPNIPLELFTRKIPRSKSSTFLLLLAILCNVNTEPFMRVLDRFEQELDGKKLELENKNLIAILVEVATEGKTAPFERFWGLVGDALPIEVLFALLPGDDLGVDKPVLSGLVAAAEVGRSRAIKEIIIDILTQKPGIIPQRVLQYQNLERRLESIAGSNPRIPLIHARNQFFQALKDGDRENIFRFAEIAHAAGYINTYKDLGDWLDGRDERELAYETYEKLPITSRFYHQVCPIIANQRISLAIMNNIEVERIGHLYMAAPFALATQRKEDREEFLQKIAAIYLFGNKQMTLAKPIPLGWLEDMNEKMPVSEFFRRLAEHKDKLGRGEYNVEELQAELEKEFKEKEALEREMKELEREMKEPEPDVNELEAQLADLRLGDQDGPPILPGFRAAAAAATPSPRTAPPPPSAGVTSPNLNIGKT